MSLTTANLRRKIASAGDLQSVVRTMKALAAASIGQYEKSVRALGDYHRAVELGLGVCFRESDAAPWPVAAKRRIDAGAIGVAGSQTTTLRALILEYLFVSLFRACAESLASENASRLAAMERADHNIDELLATLGETFHRLRQSSIDAELFDVIAGVELLAKKAMDGRFTKLTPGKPCAPKRIRSLRAGLGWASSWMAVQK